VPPVYVAMVSLTPRWVVVDCREPAALARFWADALEREPGDGGDDWASLPGDPHLFFVEVADERRGKLRWHLDWDSSDREADVERLVGLGATRLADRAEPSMGLEWTTLADPEGNEFCVVRGEHG
jgi:Glyoxalase-like domain